MGCEVDNPNKGRLRDLERAEHFLGGGTDVGIIGLRLEFLWDKIAGDDEALLDREYEEFLIRRAQIAIDDLEGLKVK